MRLRAIQLEGEVSRVNKRVSGVSLIVALGALAVFTLMVMALLLVVRTDRQASRAFVNDVRAKHLLHAAIVNAISNINNDLAAQLYSVDDAWTSGSGSPAVDLLTGEASNFVPRALWADVSTETSAQWTDIVHGGITNGRVAYLVINCSGLLDANIVGGEEERTKSASVEELNLSGLPDTTLASATNLFGDTGFFGQRNRHVRYESVEELGRVNSGVTDPSYNFFIYSYDPGRDQYYTNISELGSFDISLYEKSPVNDVTNYGGSESYSTYESDFAFASNYFEPLLQILDESGLGDSDALAWNIVNYIDADRIPQSDALEPWLSGEVSEAIPLINEVSLQQVSGQPTNHYAISAELWFPFYPATVSSNGDFEIEVGVFTNSSDDLDSNPSAEWSFIADIGEMTFGDSNTEFLVFSSPTNQLINFPNPSSNGPAYLPVSSTNPVWFMGRVILDGVLTVDQAPGSNTLMFTSETAYSVNDPRVNGDLTRWETADETLGWINSNCTAWADDDLGQGLPIFHRDGPMETIGELGHIYNPGNSNQLWHNVDILSPEGAFLMDRMTVRSTNDSTRGLVSMNSAQTNVLGTLLHGVEIGYSNEFVSSIYTLDMNSDPVRQLTSAVEGGGWYYSFKHMFGISSVGDAFRDCVSSTVTTNTGISDILREAPLRNMVEMVTWRQNLFTIIVASQALGSDGQTPVAEKRGVAVVYRDAYTGKSFIQSFRMLTR